MDIFSLHQAMLDPATYPAGEGPVEFRETHVSRLYLTRHFVYKIKKPVNFGFLDFTTLEKRCFFCREEVRLNRRFAPDTYLDVVTLCRTATGMRLGGSDDIIDYAVHMRRLPAQQMLDYRLAINDPALAVEMVRVGYRFAELHAEAPICRENGGHSNRETIRLNWQENFRQAASFSSDILTCPALGLLTTYVNQFIDTHATLFSKREENGFVRDGHGDLHTEHICLTDPIRIYDCIEFNRRFRIADTAADLAFLLMDLEFRGRGDLAALVEKAYQEKMEDPDLAHLLPFYKIYRAFVRGKVEAFLASDRSVAVTTRQEAANRAGKYFNLALGYLCPPVWIVIGGLMGTGKSTVAAALVKALGGTLLRSDSIRKELAGAQAAVGHDAPFGERIYTAEFNRRTHDVLLQRSREKLGGGTVVTDASFLRRNERKRFRKCAEQAGVPIFTILTACDRQTALERLDSRQKSGNDPSDGRRELYDRQALHFEPLLPDENAIVIDTHQPVTYNVQSLLCEIVTRAGMRR